MEISSNQQGILGALCNPTELAFEKGNIQQHYPIDFEGTTYPDVESAYQANKNKNIRLTKEIARDFNKNYLLIVKLILIKLITYPRLFKTIEKSGGIKWILSCTHEPYKPGRESVWSTKGGNWFITALATAYSTAKYSSLLKPKFKHSAVARACKDDNYIRTLVEVMDVSICPEWLTLEHKVIYTKKDLCNISLNILKELETNNLLKSSEFLSIKPNLLLPHYNYYKKDLMRQMSKHFKTLLIEAGYTYNKVIIRGRIYTLLIHSDES